MRNHKKLFVVHVAAIVLAVTAAAPFGASARARSAPAPMTYAIKNAKIMTVSGAPITGGTILMRDGVIADVGTSVTVPDDAVVIDGANLTVYPGYSDMANSTAVETPAAAAPAPPQTGGGGQFGGGGRGGGAPAAGEPTLEDNERARRSMLLRPNFDAASNIRNEGVEMQRLAAAGITSVLAVPPAGTIRGTSALVNVVAPTDDVQYSNIGEYRGGYSVIRTPVALHVGFGPGGGGGGRGGGGGANAYPGTLLGYISFIRQSFLDAQWQKDARAWAERHKDGARPAFEPALDAMVPALERKLPVAFDASDEREIYRALSMAKEFNLDPIVVGAGEGAAAVSDLKAANARVIYSLNFPTAPGAGGSGRAGGGGGGGGRGGGGGGGEETLAQVRARVNAPKAPAVFEKAGVPFAFTTGGLQNAADFVRNAARTVKEGNLSADLALKALTLNAAKLAGAEARLGTLEKGKVANVVVSEGDIFDNGRIRHVFVDGRPINIDVPAAAPAGRGGRGGGQ
ncbi:MAG TPA: amidohydrolase family protein [Vicinamibacterales bacterium]|nr:amidohydrolase family protein [Vicinamibacterales bacterium]